MEADLDNGTPVHDGIAVTDEVIGRIRVVRGGILFRRIVALGAVQWRDHVGT